MKHLAAYLLLALGGNEQPSASDIKSLLETVGIEADGEKLDALVSSLAGKSLEELIAEGSTKLSSMPAAGGAAPAAAGGAAAAPAEAAAEEKKEEEAKEESDDDMGFGLFD